MDNPPWIRMAFRMGYCPRLEGGKKMRIYFGGAHNGKRQYVRNLLQDEGQLHVQWIESELPTPGTNPVVIAGIENWLAKTNLSEEEAIAHIIKQTANRDIIFILTDIGRGIVPIDAKQRNLRDVSGRLNQRLFAEADEVTRIWYGIAQIIKPRNKRVIHYL